MSRLGFLPNWQWISISEHHFDFCMYSELLFLSWIRSWHQIQLKQTTCINSMQPNRFLCILYTRFSSKAEKPFVAKENITVGIERNIEGNSPVRHQEFDSDEVVIFHHRNEGKKPLYKRKEFETREEVRYININSIFKKTKIAIYVLLIFQVFLRNHIIIIIFFFFYPDSLFG